MTDEPMPAWAGALMEAISDLRREMNVRFDRLQNRIDSHAEDLKVTLAAAGRARHD